MYCTILPIYVRIDFQGGTSFVDLLCFCSVLCLLCFVRVCLYVLRGHLLGKGWPLGSRLWCLLWVCHFPIGILGQVWYLIVSIPDLCNLTYFYLLGLCNFTKLSNTNQHNTKVLKHSIRISIWPLRNNNKLLSESPIKHKHATHRCQQHPLAWTSVSNLNQAFTNIVNPHMQFTIIVKPLRWSKLFYIILWTSTKFVQSIVLWLKLAPCRGSHILQRYIR